jgi:hypothetical protein
MKTATWETMNIDDSQKKCARYKIGDIVRVIDHSYSNSWVEALDPRNLDNPDWCPEADYEKGVGIITKIYPSYELPPRLQDEDGNVLVEWSWVRYEVVISGQSRELDEGLLEKIG